MGAVYVCVSVCSPAFYSAVDNMSSPSPQSEKVENHAVCVCVCVHYIHLRSGNGEWMCAVKGKAGGFMCVHVFLSFPPLANAYF